MLDCFFLAFTFLSQLSFNLEKSGKSLVSTFFLMVLNSCKKRKIRNQKELMFVEINDGSGFKSLQVVVDKAMGA